MIKKQFKFTILLISSILLIIAFTPEHGENARPPLINYNKQIYMYYDSVEELPSNNIHFAKIISTCDASNQPQNHLESNQLDIGTIIYYLDYEPTYLYTYNPYSEKYIRYKLLD